MEFTNENRRLVYEIIRLNEGISFREIGRNMEIGFGSVQHHIKVLLKQKRIEALLFGRYKRFFIPKHFFEIEKQHEETLRRILLHFLRVKNTNKILRFMYPDYYTNNENLAHELKISIQAIIFHLKRLKFYNVIIEMKEGRKKFFFINDEFKPILQKLL